MFLDNPDNEEIVAIIEENKDIKLKFRGSSNQRIIDVQRSLHENKTITISKYDVIINEKIYQKDATIFI